MKEEVYTLEDAAKELGVDIINKTLLPELDTIVQDGESISVIVKRTGSVFVMVKQGQSASFRIEMPYVPMLLEALKHAS